MVRALNYRSLLFLSWISLILSVLVFGASASADPTISVAIDPKHGTISDIFQMRVRVQDPDSAEVPQLLPQNDFKARFAGVTQAHRITGLKVERYADFTYQLTPLRTGDLKTPQAIINSRKGTISAPTLDVFVEESNATAEETQDIQIKQFISTPGPYFIGQQLRYTVEILSRVNIYEPNLDTSNLPGFFSENLGDQEIFSRKVNGRVFTVTRLERAIYPNQSGKLEITPRNFSGKILIESNDPVSIDPMDPFSSSLFKNFFKQREFKGIQATSEPLSLEIKELPPLQKQVGLSPKPIVGSTIIEVTPRESSIKFGETAKFTVLVKSTGRLASLKSLNLPDTTSYKVYEKADIPSFNNQEEPPFFSRKFDISLVPLHGGAIYIDPLEIQFFDPYTQQYVIAKSNSTAIRISGGPEAPATAPTIAPENTQTTKEMEEKKAEYWEPSQFSILIKRMSEEAITLILLAVITFTLITILVLNSRKKSRDLHQKVTLPYEPYAEISSTVRSFIASSLKLPLSDIYISNVHTFPCNQIQKVKISRALEILEDLRDQEITSYDFKQGVNTLNKDLNTIFSKK